MADDRTRNRSNSIFSDDDRGEGRWRDDQPRAERWRSEDYGWGGDPGRRTDPQREHASGERGFLEKAGDEVRSWFGDDEAERRREQDARETPGGPSQQGDRQDWTGSRAEPDQGSRYERTQLRSNQAQPHSAARADDEQGGFGDGGFGGVRQTGAGGRAEPRFTHHHDESYRRWRDEQIAALDRDYAEYRSHRQQQFEQDFSTFRQGRQSQLTSGGATLSQSGQDRTAQVSTSPASAGASDPQSAGELTTGTETVTAEPASESGSRSARNR